MSSRYAYPYCKHGTYILTEYDCVCGACEMGDPEPSVNELREGQRARYSRHAEQFTRVATLALQHPNFGDAVLVKLTLTPHVVEIQRRQQEIEYVRSLALDDDDTDWLNREHNRRVDEWYSMEDDDQNEASWSAVMMHNPDGSY